MMNNYFCKNVVARNDSFGYNSRSELTSVNIGNGEYAYAFDTIGNRLTAEELAMETQYTTNNLNQYLTETTLPASLNPDSSQTTQDASSPFEPTFDADGNQTLIKTSTGIWSVSYNAENRPITFTKGTTTIHCKYDSLGRRFEKKVIENGATVFWDPSESVATRPLAISIANVGTYFYTHDLTKNVCELIAEQGGWNLYSILGNDLISKLDIYGLVDIGIGIGENKRNFKGSINGPGYAFDWLIGWGLSLSAKGIRNNSCKKELEITFLLLAEAGITIGFARRFSIPRYDVFLLAGLRFFAGVEASNTFSVTINSCADDMCTLKSRIGLKNVTIDAFSNLAFVEVSVNLYEYTGEMFSNSEEITFKNPILWALGE